MGCPFRVWSWSLVKSHLAHRMNGDVLMAGRAKAQAGFRKIEVITLKVFHAKDSPR